MWSSRITRHAEAKISDLIPHPQNFRMHPAVQQEALSAAMAEIGFIHAVLVNERTGHILNGHLRVELAERDGAETIPATFVDLSPEEESTVLAMFDRLAALATTDPHKLRDLLSQAEAEAPALQQLLNQYAAEYGVTIAAAAAGAQLPELPGSRPAEPEATTARVKLGSFRCDVPIAMYRTWLAELQADVGAEEAAIVAEVRRRLRLDQPGRN